MLQVFRTYNASITLDRLLTEMEEVGDSGGYEARLLEAKKADYDRANKEVRGGHVWAGRGVRFIGW
jgi:DNA topoisomerase I